ncbi:hypothetical protein, partial [Streptomyces sparsus]
EELRKRLGGFQQGARDGHRDVAAQLGADNAPGPRDENHRPPRPNGDEGRRHPDGEQRQPDQPDQPDPPGESDQPGRQHENRHAVLDEHDQHENEHHQHGEEQDKPGADDNGGTVEEARQ